MRKRTEPERLILTRMRDEGITQYQMAKAFGITDKTFRTWLKSPESGLTYERLNVIADILHMSDREFLRMARRGYVSGYELR